ncbi:hypothetical protein BGW42_006298 [Actinomortierella wolfii]|nr:hypothetical protein BGW42_006298 [Actinomortierella wolfii]
MDVCMHLTWAFFGHRLDEVEELEINVKDQERYLSNIAKMTSLHKIWIFTGKKSNHDDMYDFAEAMIKSIQSDHGPHQLSECHMIPNPLTQYRPFGGVDLSPIWRVVSLLPPPRHHRTLPTPDGSIALLNQPLDPYVATIENLSDDDFRFNSTWVALMRVYPGHSDSQLLQRLRGLTSLSIPCKMANGNDDNLLAWAAYEAEHYSHIPDVYHSVLLVPLENLEIVYGHTRFGSPPPKWKILQDGLLGFSGTLKSLSVFYPQFENVTVGRVFTIPRPLLKLKSLKLRGLTIDRSVWEQAPNIEEL